MPRSVDNNRMPRVRPRNCSLFFFFFFYFIVVCFSGVFPNRLTVPRRHRITSRVDTFCCVVRYFCSILKGKKRDSREEQDLSVSDPTGETVPFFCCPLGKKVGGGGGKKGIFFKNKSIVSKEESSLLYWGWGQKSDKFRLQRWLKRQCAPPSWLGM